MSLKTPLSFLNIQFTNLDEILGISREILQKYSNIFKLSYL